jgi:hypothetical protein
VPAEDCDQRADGQGCRAAGLNEIARMNLNLFRLRQFRRP